MNRKQRRKAAALTRAVPKRPPVMPWEFSREPAPDEPAVPNLPTPEGRELGGHLARFAEAARPEWERRWPTALPMCHDCAFRAGTDPNGSAETLMDAVKCLAEHVPFYCHHGVKDGEPKRLCTGFSILATTKKPEARP